MEAVECVLVHHNPRQMGKMGWCERERERAVYDSPLEMSIPAKVEGFLVAAVNFM